VREGVGRPWVQEMMLWAYPKKEEKKVETKTLSEEQRAGPRV
jgi:hypothetical protein